MLIYTSWQLTIFTIIVLPALGWAMGRIGRKLKRQSLDAQNKWSETMAQLEETLGGMRIVKAFTAERKMQERFDRTTDEFRDASTRVQVRQASAHPVSEFLGTCLIVLVLWYGGTLIFSAQSPIDAPTFIFYMVILYSIIQPLKDLSKASYNIPKGMASVVRVNKILDADNPIKEKPEAEAIKALKDEIVFHDVHFFYATGKEILAGIDLRVKRGQTIALVGQSGSGKSTLVDLLPRYHDVCGGSITIDGKDVRDLRIASLRSLIGNVNQEAILFNDTFRANIAFGVEDATDAQIEEAARIANAHDFIMASEQGYDTLVGDRGCRLSGGQRQRISIARAILKTQTSLSSTKQPQPLTPRANVSCSKPWNASCPPARPLPSLTAFRPFAMPTRFALCTKAASWSVAHTTPSWRSAATTNASARCKGTDYTRTNHTA